MTSKLALFAVLLALAPTGCAVAPQNGDEATVDDATEELTSLVVTEKDAGRTVTVPEGQPLVVKLLSNPTTGYDWRVVSTDRTFGYPSSTTHVASSAAVGAGGVTKLTWKTQAGIPMIGAHVVKLGYQRASDTRAEKTFQITVRIVARVAAPVTLDADDEGKTVSAKLGQPIVVALASNPTTGYDWQVVSTDRSFGYPNITFESSSKAIGAGGTTKLTWRTDGAFQPLGTHAVKLEYRRSWEPVGSGKAYAFKVTISK